MKDLDEIFGISVSVPPEHADGLMDAIDSVMEPVYPGYGRSFAVIPCRGTWKTLEGAHPYNGEIGKITYADEVRLEFVCRGKDLRKVLETIEKVHPYEEPAVNVVPQKGWRGYLTSDSS